MVLFTLVDKAIALIVMSDPTIQSYTRPLYEEEIAQKGYLNLDEYRFNFGVYISSENDTKGNVEIPEGIGRVV